MKKAILIIMLLLSMAVFCSCGNYELATADMFEFDYAQISMPDGSIVAGDVQKWSELGTGVIVVCIDDTTYATHAENIAMIANGKEE